MIFKNHYADSLWIGLLVAGLIMSDSCGQINGSKDQLVTLENNEVKGIVPETVDFSLYVKPILSDRCFICHGPDKNTVECGLSLHTAEGAYAAVGEKKGHYAIVPGDVEKSELVNWLFILDKPLIMPPRNPT